MTTFIRPVQNQSNGNTYVEIRDASGNPVTFPSTQTDDSTLPATPQFLPAGAEYRATPTVYADGDGTVLQSDINGYLKVVLGKNIAGEDVILDLLKVGGNVDHDAVDTGYPVKFGGKASTSAPTAVSVGDRVNAWFDTNGRLMIGGYSRGNGVMDSDTIRVVTASDGPLNTNLGAVTDAAVVTDADGTVSAKLRGLVKMIAAGIGAKPNTLDVTLSNVSALNGDLYAATDVTGYKSFYIQLTGTWSGTVSFQGSNDNTNWTNVAVLSLATNSGQTQNSATGNALYMGQITFKYMRVRVTSYSSGTVAGAMVLNTFPLGGFHTMAVIANATGPAASGAALNGNPIRVAGAYNSTQPTVTTGQIVDLQASARGALYVTNGVEPLNVGGVQDTISNTPTLSVPGAYAAGDYVGTSAVAMILSGMARSNNGSGIILSARLIDKAAQSAPAELWIFDSAITPPTDNAAWSISDADAAKLVGVIPFSSYYASALNSVSVANNIGQAFKTIGNDTKLYACLVTRGTPTYADGDVIIELEVLQN